MLLLLHAGVNNGQIIKMSGFGEFFKLSARVIPASLNLSTVFSSSNNGLPKLKYLDFLNFCLYWKSLDLTESEKDRS